MATPPKRPSTSPTERLSDGPGRRRAHRASVKFRLRGVYLRCDEMSAREIRALNISETGIGLEVGGIKQLPDPNQTLKAKLLVGKVATPVTIRFVHANTEIAGFEFLDSARIFQSAIGAIFEPELVGTSLRTVQPTRAHLLRFSDGRHTAIEVAPKGEGPEARFSEPPSGFGHISFLILGGEIEAKPGAPIVHRVGGRTEPLSDFLRQILIRILKNAVMIPEPLRGQLERHFTAEPS